MERSYTISQLARAASVPISTLRYYERAGLICPAGRAQNNYRLYTRDTLQTIHFIRAAQATGFTLDDVRTILALWNGNIALCKDVQPLIAKRLEQVSQRLQEIQHIQHILTALLEMCHNQEQNTPCQVIDKLMQ